MVLCSVVYMVKIFIKNTLLVKGRPVSVPHGSHDKSAQAAKLKTTALTVVFTVPARTLRPSGSGGRNVFFEEQESSGFRFYKPQSVSQPLISDLRATVDSM